MNKSLKFTLVSAFILLTRSYDAYATYQFTPDLTREANPLSSVFGLGWTPLLLIIGSLTLYCIYAFYLRMFRSTEFLPTQKGLDFQAFSVSLYLGKPGRWVDMLFKLPTSGNRFNQYMGDFMTICLVFAGIVSTLMWLGIRHTAWYPPLHSATLIYGILVVGCIALILIRSKQLYNQYLTQIET